MKQEKQQKKDVGGDDDRGSAGTEGWHRPIKAALSLPPAPALLSSQPCTFERVDRLGGLDVVEDVLARGGLLTPRSHHDARASNDLDGLALSVEASKSSPLAESLVVLDLDQRDGMLLAQRSDELGVGRLIARVGEHAQVRLTAIQRLDGLVESARESIMEHGGAQHNLERGHGVQLNLLDDHLLNLDILNIIFSGHLCFVCFFCFERFLFWLDGPH